MEIRNEGKNGYWEDPSAEATAGPASGDPGTLTAKLGERLHLSEIAAVQGQVAHDESGSSFWPTALLGVALAAFGVAVFYFGKKQEIPEKITEYARTHWLH